MNRRHFLISIGAAGTAIVLPAGLIAAARGTPAITDLEELTMSWTDFLPDDADLPDLDSPLSVTRDEWQQRLPADAFRVLFKQGTERAGSSALDDEKRRGVFVCRACDLPLFTSQMKFDSGTGWPSFFTGIPEHLETSRDFKMILPRTEYHCARCGGHQGHVFKDGPQPTGQRWCNNGVALRFVSSDGAAAS